MNEPRDELQDRSRGVSTDMSPAAIERRLQIVSDLFSMWSWLRTARKVPPANDGLRLAEQPDQPYGTPPPMAASDAAAPQPGPAPSTHLPPSIPCQQCRRELGPIARRKAFLALSVHGDEEVRSWFFCETCRAWTLEFLDDRFVGETTVTIAGPFAEAQGAADVALAKTCPNPGDKWCECQAHRHFAP